MAVVQFWLIFLSHILSGEDGADFNGEKEELINVNTQWLFCSVASETEIQVMYPKMGLCLTSYDFEGFVTPIFVSSPPWQNTLSALREQHASTGQSTRARAMFICAAALGEV